MELINKQAVIDALCAVCGKACDKSKFVYNAPQDEQVILCPEHYCLCASPPAEPKKGKWIRDGHHIRCDQCGMYICDTDREGDKIPNNFCPNCGSYNGGEINDQ